MDVVGKTIIEVMGLRSGKTVLMLDDGTHIMCSFPAHMNGNPIRSKFGRKADGRPKADIVIEADQMRSEQEISHLGDRTPRRKVVIGGDDDIPEFLQDHVGIQRTDSESRTHAFTVQQSTSDIPDIK